MMLPGMGDEATWPPCTNDPMDPRTPEDFGEEYDPEDWDQDAYFEMLAEREDG